MSRKIMLVDDEPDVAAVVKAVLEKEGFAVACCSDGRKAWEDIIAFKPDLVLLDVMLPGVDGWSLQKRLAEEPSTHALPVIVITALEPAKTLFAKSPQVAGFLTKPFEPQELMGKIRSALPHND